MVANPATSSIQLAQLANLFPQLHPQIAQHPQASPDLLNWLATSRDPAVQRALASRRSTPPTPGAIPPTAVADPAAQAPITPAPKSSLPLVAGIVIGVVVLALIVLLAVWALGPKKSASATQPSAGLPSGAPSCPSGTTQLAFATFADGWVLVCGSTTTSPSQWYSSDSGRSFESSSVNYSDMYGRYTAQFGNGAYGWLNHMPAVYGRSTNGYQVDVQRSVGTIWFSGGGQGQTGSSTGPFGIPAPGSSAADQVRYLSALLTKSAKARAELQPAVISVRDCERGDSGDYSTDVSVISSVADNRTQLLSALDSAPVDQIPNGTSLVTELRTSLQYSLSADNAYLAWAKTVNASGCGAGSEASGQAYSKKAGNAKTVFVNHWNSSIAPTYGVATVSRETL